MNPPFPAEVEVKIDYYPQSDPDRRVTWIAKGQASSFGHFFPYEKPPLVFDEPGEYISLITARYTDARGNLWMGQQTSAGVIAPLKPEITLHGSRSFPYGHRMDRDYFGAVKRFSGRQDLTTSFFPSYTPSMLPDPYAPYDPRDTLFIPSNGFNESLVEPHLSMSPADPELAARLQAELKHASFPVPPSHQPSEGKWEYMQDVVQISSDSFSWFPADATHRDELPVVPVGNGRWHPYAFAEFNRIEAYTYIGVVRPGFPVMTAAYQTDAIGLYWLASPNRFGFHFNTGANGDLPGDVYRVQAGAVVLDHETGRKYYDAYAAAIAVAPSEGKATSISPPGERPLVQANGREQFVFIALDTHDAMEVGEVIGLGGMVFPAVEAEMTWEVTKPSGEVVIVKGTTNRLGLGRGRPAVAVDEPGIYLIKAGVEYEGIHGDIVGTADGTYWHCAVPRERRPLLTTPLAAVTGVDAREGVAIRLTWPGWAENARLHYGVMMPGQVLDQGVVTDASGAWEYDFQPLQRMVQFPNFDVRNFATGELELADTVVFQFFLEAEIGGEKVHDALRLVLRDDKLYDYQKLLAPGH